MKILIDDHQKRLILLNVERENAIKFKNDLDAFKKLHSNEVVQVSTDTNRVDIPPEVHLKPITLKDDDLTFSKENVAKLSINLYNLIRCLRDAFKGLNIIKGTDIVMAIGNTGVGKSTMLTSLVFGKEKLQLIDLINTTKRQGKVK